MSTYDIIIINLDEQFIICFKERNMYCMKNEEYGISAIKLIFTVVILALIITGIVFVVQKLWHDNNVNDIETYLLSIQGKCKGIYGKNVVDSNNQLLGEKITEYKENEEINNIISQSDKWYKLSQQDLETIGEGKLKAEDGILVNYEENDIIYLKGIKKDDNIFYRLSDLNREEQEKQEEQPSQPTETPVLEENSGENVVAQ